MRLGIFLPNWIGDVVMATPALRALRNHFGPEAYFVGLMRPYVADVLAGGAWLDDVVRYTKVATRPEYAARAAVAQLRAAQLDEMLLFTNSFRTAWMAWQCRTPVRTGLVGNGRRWLLTRRLAQPKHATTGRPLSAIETYLYLAQSLGCPPEPLRLELATTAADEQLADTVWERLGLPPGEEVVVFNTGGAYGDAKNWPAEHFAALAGRIAAELGHWVLVNCGPAERDAAQEIVARADDRRVVSLADERKLPVGLSKACIGRGRMLVTTDSGPRYFGIAFGKPVVTLFGPTDPRLVETHYDRETVFALGLDCQPCMARSCPLGHHGCMRDLTPEMVFQAVAQHLRVPPVERSPFAA